MNEIDKILNSIDLFSDEDDMEIALEKLKNMSDEEIEKKFYDMQRQYLIRTNQLN
jgi:hypothetical protein